LNNGGLKIAGILFALFVLSLPVGNLIHTKAMEGKAQHRRELLVSALEKRWSGKHYRPSPAEIRQWLDSIERYDTFLLEPLRYIAMIDKESSGNPTARGDGGESRGLGGVKVIHLITVCYKHQLFIPPRKEVALYNPDFNVRMMVLGYQDLYRLYKNHDDAGWGYNSGMGNVAERKRANEDCDKYNTDVEARMAEIGRLIYQMEKRKE